MAHAASPCRAVPFFFLSVLGLVLVLTGRVEPVRAEGKVLVHLFWAEGCPHCVKEKAFLASLASRSPWLEVRAYEVVYDQPNMELFQAVARELGETTSGVPFAVICDKPLVGWLGEDSTGLAIETLAGQARSPGCRDLVGEFAARQASGTLAPSAPAPGESQASVPGAPGALQVPLFGEIRTKDLSLPLLTVLFAAVDGFNPCAMWVLVFLIGLLLGLEDRARMWILGGVFLLASAGMYYAVLAAWMNVLFALGYVRWLRAAVGLLALAGGAFSLREYFITPAGVCRVTEGGGRRRVLDRLRALSRERRLWLAAVGIAVLAVVVNFIELVCSAGLPAVYTQILALNDLPGWQYHAFLMLYIAVFLLDDAAIFIAAMVTLKVAGLSGRYSRASHLVGGVVLVAVGVLLIFKPEWLMFG
ncbi:MAG: hypothetical protein ACLGSA_02135 [Acidobacteriota bacterium]